MTLNARVAAYERHAEPTLIALRDAIDAIAADDIDADDIDAELAGGVLTIELGDGARYVANSHRAALQIWLAAESQAWHFDWQESAGAWIAAKSGEELFATIEGLISRRLGTTVRLQRG